MLRIEDQMRKLAALTGVMLIATAEALAQENRRRPARRIVVSIPDRKLAVLECGPRVEDLPDGRGRARIAQPRRRLSNYHEHPRSHLVLPGQSRGPRKEQPLGTRWLGLSIKGYGIHGTNNPASIGKNASHGCVRMRNRDVEELFGMVGVGDQVELYADRTPELDRIFGEPVAVACAQ